jgi:purine-binding chemotaxis protein CheW
MSESKNVSMKEQTKTGELRRFLEFSLGSEAYAVPLLSVKEVIAYPDITRIPYTPPHFLGIMNLRGQVISVIDLRTKFGIKTEQNAETAVIICDLAPLCIGIVVNSVNSVLPLHDSDISDRPDIQSSKSSDYITGVTRQDQKLVLLLDMAKAIDVEDQSAAKKAQESRKAA